MNEYICNECGEYFKCNGKLDCPKCGSDDIEEVCPMCGTKINPDNKVCPECKEAVA